MRHFWFGLFIGILLTFVVGWFGLGWLDRSINRPTPATGRTGAAGTSQNYANQVAAGDRLRLTLGLADSSASQPAVPITDYTSLEITFTKAEAGLLQTANERAKQAPPNLRWEVLNITQPTIELFSLRGSGSVAELGTTELAAGDYQTIRLTLQSIKARRSSGQIMDLPITDGNQTIEISRNFSWLTTGEDIQVVLNLDSLRSLVKNNGADFFQPALVHVIQNDQILSGF